MIILGFNHGHDGGSTLVIDGEIVASISEERLNRIKKNIDVYLDFPPVQSMLYCVNAANISLKDVDLFVFNQTDHKRVWATGAGLHRVIEFLHYTYGISRDKFEYISHHDAHIYSSFLTSTFDESCVIVADGAGEDVRIENKEENEEIPPSLGFEYLTARGYDLVDTEDPNTVYTEAWTVADVNYAGITDIEKKWVEFQLEPAFEGVNETTIGGIYDIAAWQLVSNFKNWPSAGKVMGLASYADKDWVNRQELPYKIENDNLTIQSKPVYPEVTENSTFQEKANVAGIYQKSQEDSIMYLAEKSKRNSNSKNLCVTGGSFLNCNTNYNILTSGLYENVHLFPALDDSGISIGAALYGALKYDKVIHKDFFNPYLGRTYSDSEILKAANKEDAVFVTKYQSEKKLIEKTVELLSNNKVVGWFQGGSEIGPRALGNRSILASPMSDGMRAHINSNVKLREWYRPFAPAVLYEKQKEIFDFDYFSPYMLVTAEVKEEWRSRIPSVTHHDNTARYQSVTPETNSKFYNLIKEFDKETGVPVLLNTSFNGPKEPIVETPEDAIRSFLELEINYLVIGNFLIQKR